MELHYSDVKIALITGGAGGIGTAITLELLELGCTVLVIDNDASALKTLESKAQEYRGTLIVYEFDLAKTESLEHFFLSEIASTYDPITTLICCAGIHEGGESFTLDLQDWRKLYAINLESCFILSKLVGHHMMETNAKGSIIFISSIHSHIIRGMPSYSTAKAALDMLSKELAHRFGRSYIRVNTVAPGSIDSPLLRRALGSQEMFDRAAQRVPLGRLGKPEEVAYLVSYLLSDEAAYINGATLVIDGGVLLSR